MKLIDYELFLDKDTDEFKIDIIKGFSNNYQKQIPSKYLYDNYGSELFELITIQPEYYPTRTEIEILKESASKIIDLIKNEIFLIELGSGSSKKTKILFEKVLQKQNRLLYFPIDISFNFLNTVVSEIESKFNKIIVKGIPSDYINGIERCNKILYENGFDLNKITKLIIFFGSSIGNFELEDARIFLKSLRKNMSNNDYLLIGFDLVKDINIIERAYNDKERITSKFNLNILSRINKELGGNFEIHNYYHKAFYNSDKKRIEMHIVAKKEQQICLSSLNFSFIIQKNESIHTENSYKYSQDDIETLSKKSGFIIAGKYTDKNKWFELVLLKPN